MQNLGLRFKKIRKLISKSQDSLAKELDVTKQAISNIETAKSLPSIAVLEKLVLKFEVNLNFLIANVGNPFIEEKRTYESICNSLMSEIGNIMSNINTKQ